MVENGPFIWSKSHLKTYNFHLSFFDFQGEAKSAQLIGEAIANNPAFTSLRRIEAARDIAHILANSANKIYLNSDDLLLNLQKLQLDAHKLRWFDYYYLEWSFQEILWASQRCQIYCHINATYFLVLVRDSPQFNFKVHLDWILVWKNLRFAFWDIVYVCTKSID